LVVPTHQNEIEKTTNSPLRLCPNLAKETIQIGFEFKYFDHHEGTTHPSESSLGRYCSKNHNLKLNSFLQTTMTPLPYWRHQRVHDPKRSQNP